MDLGFWGALVVGGRRERWRRKDSEGAWEVEGGGGGERLSFVLIEI